MSALYFIAVIAEEPVFTEVHAFKEMAAELFETRRALRSPPHITLYPPFRMNPEEVDPCVKTLSIEVKEHAGFSLELNGFDAFPPRVIFVRVEENAALQVLQSTIAGLICNRFGLEPSARPFHAHMTVAFKDLRRSMFKPALEHFQSISYRRTLVVQAIWLLRHEQSGWQAIRQIPLG